MRILQIHNEYALPGGEDTIADAEAELLGAAGHTVGRLRTRNPDAGLPAVRALAGAAWNPAAARDITALVHRERPDVAHVHNTWFVLSPAVLDALRRAGVPTVMTLQNYRLLCAKAQLFRDGRPCTDCVGRSPWLGVAHRCYRGSAPQSAVAALTISVARARRTWERVDRFIAPSRFVADLFIAAGMPADRLAIKPNVVEDPGGRAAPPSRSRVLLYAGRLSPEKGVRELLAGWAQAGERTGDLELHLVGDGPLRAELEALAIPRVRFLGWSEPAELGRLMLAARTLLFPSVWFENFGRVIVEALAAGLPVLASDIATPAEVVGRLGPAWLVPPGDPTAWADALARLTDDAAVDDAGRRGRELFERDYTFAQGLQALERIYGEVTGSTVGTEC